MTPDQPPNYNFLETNESRNTFNDPSTDSHPLRSNMVIEPPLYDDENPPSAASTPNDTMSYGASLPSVIDHSSTPAPQVS